MSLTIEPIGTIHSPFREKFSIPRQPQIIESIECQLIVKPPFSDRDAFRGIESFSHLWVLFLFHQHYEKTWQPLVRPPRLGGNEKVGVFATRSSFRPNHIGQSVVKLNRVDYRQQQTILHVTGGDFLDNTPLIDIKPYVTYADSVADAQCGFAAHSPETNLTVTFDNNAERLLASIQSKHPNFKELIIAILAQDPRPAYKRNNEDDKVYGSMLYDYNIRWRIENHQVIVTDIQPIHP